MDVDKLLEKYPAIQAYSTNRKLHSQSTPIIMRADGKIKHMTLQESEDYDKTLELFAEGQTVGLFGYGYPPASLKKAEAKANSEKPNNLETGK